MKPKLHSGDTVVVTTTYHDINGEIEAGTVLTLSSFQREQDGAEIWTAWGTRRLVATSSALIKPIDTRPKPP